MLLEALKELNETIVATENKLDNEAVLMEVEKKYGIKKGKLVPYYNLFKTLKDVKTVSVNGHSVWTDSELMIINNYVNEQKGKEAVAKILSDVASLLKNRTEKATHLVYYSKVRKNAKNLRFKDELYVLNKSEVALPNVEETENVVEVNEQLSIEPISVEEPKQKVVKNVKVVQKVDKEEDVLDYLGTFIEKTSEISDVDLNGFFKGLAVLSKMATEKEDDKERTAKLEQDLKGSNENVLKLEKELQISIDKLSEMEKELRTSNEKVHRLENNLKVKAEMLEKVDEKQKLLVQLVYEFYTLSGPQKIVKVNDFSRKMLSILDGEESIEEQLDKKEQVS